MASGDLAKLGIQVDSSQAKAAAGDLDKLAASATAAEAATADLGATNAATAKATDTLRAAFAANGAVTAEQVKAAGGWAAAQKILRDSTTSTAKTVASAGATSVAASEAAADAAVTSSAVQVAANERVVASSLQVRESLVLLREASIGNYTRMAGSASILIQSMGLLEAAIAVILPVAIALGGALELGNEQINYGVRGTGDLTRGLGLTADQLDKVKDRTVTLKDTFKATFQVLGRDILGLFGGEGTVWASVKSGMDKLAYGLRDGLEFFAGSFVGVIEGIIAAWSKLPAAVMDALTIAANATLSGIQTVINAIISGINTVIDYSNKLNNLPGIGNGVTVGHISPVDLGQVKNAYAGAGTSAGQAFATGFSKGLNDTAASMDKFFSDVAAQARKNRIAEILKEAGKAKGGAGDKQIDNALAQLAEVQAEVKAQDALNQSVISGTASYEDYNKAVFVAGKMASILKEAQADLATSQDAKASAAARAKAIEDYKALQPIIENLTKAYGQLYDKQEEGKVIVKIIEDQTKALSDYLHTLQAVQALVASGRMSGAQGNLELSNTQLYKNTASAISANDNNPFGALAGMNNQFQKQGALNNQTSAENSFEQAQKAGIISAEQLAQARIEIEAQTTAKMLTIDQQYEDAKLALGQNTFDQLAQGLGAMFGKQSAAYKVAFAAEKAFQVARATLALETSIAQASAVPWPANIPAIAAAIANMGQILSAIASISAPGYADGVVNVKRTGGAATDSIIALLTPGESVVTKDATQNNMNTIAAMNAGASFDRGGGIAGKPVVSPNNVTIVNVTDANEVPKYMNTPQGHKVILNVLATNGFRPAA